MIKLITITNPKKNNYYHLNSKQLKSYPHLKTHQQNQIIRNSHKTIGLNQNKRKKPRKTQNSKRNKVHFFCKFNIRIQQNTKS